MFIASAHYIGFVMKSLKGDCLKKQVNSTKKIKKFSCTIQKFISHANFTIEKKLEKPKLPLD